MSDLNFFLLVPFPHLLSGPFIGSLTSSELNSLLSSKRTFIAAAGVGIEWVDIERDRLIVDGGTVGNAGLTRTWGGLSAIPWRLRRKASRRF